MGKLFIVEPHESAHTDVITEGLQLANMLGKTPEIFAYCYEYFSGDPIIYEEVKQQLLQHKQQQLMERLQQLEAGDVPVHVVWCKYLYEHACEYAANEGFDLVVKGIHPSEHMLPTDWQLLRTTKVPVMLLTQNPLQRGNSVLMALDLDTDNLHKQQLNRQVLQHAKTLAAATRGKLHLAYILRVPRLIRDLEVLNIQQLVKNAYRRHQQLLTEIGLPKEQIHILSGEPDLCLYQLACRLKSDYLVMGARQRQGLMGWMLGNTAEQILQRSRSNVLVIPSSS
ncbi:universal stress protein [Shewanella dokdonensis]|uniref:Universal stress protein n=1 Tax=Shewanella dokdonensis TaxID=712036 RepID=A0ABX8DCV0_9GAMM|nr:universal stress protein [Shewanella dokdonensis]MCL1074596.1 universal stress protein [Shewanella dokdonensis]QVK22393.1 universal stress protein [Shewanella dokdonensis]